QPSLPVVHRTFANPAPLGLLSFATGVFLFSLLGVHARGIQSQNIIVGVMMFFGGLCQFISGIMEFVAGNTFGATLFLSFAALNMSLAMTEIRLLTSDKAYSNTDGKVLPEFDEALAMYCWAWLILTVVFTIASIRNSWTLIRALVFFSVELLLLAVGHMIRVDGIIIAANSVGFIVALCACKCNLPTKILPC
ncbi:GPR1/FUN34/yaaH family-domain-containing protein, partial [Lipomyces doorenjongii]